MGVRATDGVPPRQAEEGEGRAVVDVELVGGAVGVECSAMGVG